MLSRASVDPSTGRRRATMRSKEHDDEEEQLKRAIEESKREVEGAESNGRRSAKRGRDESEEYVDLGKFWRQGVGADTSRSSKQDLKRQRTASETRPSGSAIENDSDDDGATPTAGQSKKAKAEANQSARQAEQREKDKEREKARAEAAGRRQERAGRRRGDGEPDSDQRSLPTILTLTVDDPADEPTPKPTPSAHTSPPLPSSQPNSPPPGGPERVSHKKGASKKLKKLGNNQYTKGRNETAASPQPPRKRPHGSPSGDDAPSTTSANGDGATSKPSPPAASTPSVTVTTTENVASRGGGKFGRGKKGAGGAGGMTNGNGLRGGQAGEEVERTFANMKAALETMSRWVARQQVDLPGSSGGGAAAAAGAAPPGGVVEGSETDAGAAAAAVAAKKFEELSSAEMAVQLQKGIATWQAQWSHMG